jgi:argininosuccinate synthase
LFLTPKEIFMSSKNKKQINKVVLAYSGGLDTSVIVPWLVDNYGCEVICFTADIGQGDELSGLPAKAQASGAKKLIIEDLQEEFASDFLFPLLRSGAVYERKYLMGTSVARPLIAAHMVKVAQNEGADAVAHGCTGKGNDQVRFELTVMALDPRLKVIAPWREWDIKSREDALHYAEVHHIPVTSTLKSIYSRDRNLWHLSHEGGLLEDPWQEPEESMYQMSVSPFTAPDTPAEIEIEFNHGFPVALDGKKMTPATLIARLNQLGGQHGVGRVDLVENRLVGMKSHGVYETPGGTILVAAHQELESITLDRDTLHYQEIVAHRYAELIYNGQWFTPLRTALDAFFESTQQHVSGQVRLKLFKGNVFPVGRKSKYSLYREDFATFGKDNVYDQSDAEGFITLFGLPMKVQAMRDIMSGTKPQFAKPDYSAFKRD